jgi:hypothetical protein
VATGRQEEVVAVDTGHQSGDRSDGVEDLEAIARAETAALKAAIATVKVSGRGQAVDEVGAGLVRELRARRLFMPPELINLLARDIADPVWALRRPWAARRRLAATMSAMDAHESAIQDEWDLTLERLEQATEALWRLRRSRISSRRTLDGFEVEIRIDPWSRRRAKKLQGIAAPTVVRVVPYDS